MPRLKLTIAYDGTDFVGYQRQLNGRSVQETLERALAKLLKENTLTEAAGRTDSGVHALGQVVSFETAQLLPLKAYGRGLNGILPEDIAVVKVEEVPPDFDPRRWSLGKRYRYLVSNAPSRNPTRLRTHWEVFTRLDRSAMQAAAVCLVGRHDFSAFRSADCQALHAVRLMREVRVEDTGEDVIQVEVEGTAFLKHMVRAVVGSLVAVGKGRHPASWMRQALESKDRSRAGPTAPPQGLTLLSVRYGEGRPAHLPPNEPGDG